MSRVYCANGYCPIRKGRGPIPQLQVWSTMGGVEKAIDFYLSEPMREFSDIFDSFLPHPVEVYLWEVRDLRPTPVSESLIRNTFGDFDVLDVSVEKDFDDFALNARAQAWNFIYGLLEMPIDSLRILTSLVTSTENVDIICQAVSNQSLVKRVRKALEEAIKTDGDLQAEILITQMEWMG